MLVCIVRKQFAANETWDITFQPQIVRSMRLDDHSDDILVLKRAMILQDSPRQKFIGQDLA